MLPPSGNEMATGPFAPAAAGPLMLAESSVEFSADVFVIETEAVVSSWFN